MTTVQFTHLYFPIMYLSCNGEKINIVCLLIVFNLLRTYIEIKGMSFILFFLFPISEEDLLICYPSRSYRFLCY